MKRRLAVWIGGAVGLIILALLLRRFGAEQIVVLGPAVLWVLGYRVFPTAARAMAWTSLFPRSDRPSFPFAFLLRWINESVNTLLPVAQVGGHVVRDRLAVRAGFEPAQVHATVVADFVIGMLTLIPFAAAGFVAIGQATGKITSVYAALALIGFAAVGLFLFPRLAGSRIFSKLGLFRHRPAALFQATAFHGISWILQVGETWLILALLGNPVSFGQAFALESSSAAVRTAAFLIPAGLGVQEGSLVGVGALLGIDGGTALALGLAKRGREVLAGVPGLLAWLCLEIRRPRHS